MWSEYDKCNENVLECICETFSRSQDGQKETKVLIS